MINVISQGSGSNGNCYLVSNETTTILLECGLPNIEKILAKNKLNMNKIDACFISHSHSDHAEYVEDYAFYEKPLFLTEETCKKYIHKIYQDIHYLKNKHIYTIKDITIYTFEVSHGDTQCFSFIFRDKDDIVFFGTDFYKMKYDFSSINFTQIFIETNYDEEEINKILNRGNQEEQNFKLMKYKRQMNVHMSVQNAIIHLKRMNLSKCKKIVGVHCSLELLNRKKAICLIQNEFGIPTFCLDSRGKEKD